MRNLYKFVAIILLVVGLNFTLMAQLQQHDDGVAENGYGWNAAAGDPSGFCQLFVPTVYPYQFTRFDIGLTRLSTGVANPTFDIVMWKKEGSLPGTIMSTTTVTATAVPVWPSVSVYQFDLPATWTTVTGTDEVYFGISFNPVTQTEFFVASDESVTTPIWDGWATTAAGPWTNITTWWAGYRALLLRTMGGDATSIMPVLNNTTINSYPNPFSNELVIETNVNKQSTFEIINSIGQVVFKGNTLGKAVVNTESFSAGVYLIKLENGKTFKTIKK